MTNFILPAFEGKKGEQSPEIYHLLSPSDLSYPNPTPHYVGSLPSKLNISNYPDRNFIRFTLLRKSIVFAALYVV